MMKSKTVYKAFQMAAIGLLQRIIRFLLAGFAMFALVSCSTIYYETWETLGKQKRDLLKDKIEDAQDDQKDVQNELKDALTHLKELYGLEADRELEKVYEQVRDDFEDSRARADALGERIDQVEKIGNDLFEEWEEEAETIKNKEFRRDSLKKRQDAQKKFGVMLASMHRSEKAIDPVMSKLQDHVLYLKHNLNAQALGSLKKESLNIQKDIAKLISDMEKSISASQEFVKTIKTS